MRGALRSCGFYVNSVNTILGEVWTDTAAAIFLKGSGRKRGEKNSLANIFRQILGGISFFFNADDLPVVMSHAGNPTWRAMRGYIKPRFEFLETSNSLVCKSRQMQNLTSWYYHSIQCFSTVNTTQRGWVIHQDHVCPHSKHGVLQLTRACLMPIKSQLPNLKVHKCRTTRKHINACKPYL